MVEGSWGELSSAELEMEMQLMNQYPELKYGSLRMTQYMQRKV
jgi:hypothetical protein